MYKRGGGGEWPARVHMCVCARARVLSVCACACVAMSVHGKVTPPPPPTHTHTLPKVSSGRIKTSSVLAKAAGPLKPEP